MANVALRLPENVAGDFFVDSTCIDCDACRQIAPRTFAEVGDFSIVFHQPENTEQTKRALMALVACPTGSIGTTEHHDAHIGIDAFPELIADNVYYCGFNAESSFGAWSYLIVRPDDRGGNVLIDSPRFATQLVKKIDAMGGMVEAVEKAAGLSPDLNTLIHLFRLKRSKGDLVGSAETARHFLKMPDVPAQFLTEEVARTHGPGLSKQISFLRGPSSVVTKPKFADRIPQRLLVFMGRADPLDA